MPYPAELTDPMRQELVRMGIQELRSPEDVDATLGSKEGTVLVFVNSVCGCAAGMARPGLALSLTHGVTPDKVVTVFAGVDGEATAQARSYFSDYQPSSPSAALIKNGEVVEMVHRHQIEGTSAQDVAAKLIQAYDEHCAS